jgi:hypothetical protein
LKKIISARTSKHKLLISSEEPPIKILKRKIGRRNVWEICFNVTFPALNIIGNRSRIWKGMVCFENPNN